MQIGKYISRDYQQRTIEALRLAIATGKTRPIVESPTGSGKRIIALFLIAGAVKRGTKAWFLTDRRLLVDQMAETLRECQIAHSVLMAGHDYVFSDVTIISKDTMVSRLDSLHVPRPGLIVVDECHVSLAPDWQRLLNLHSVPVIGLSATPESNGKGLGAFYNTIIKAASYDELKRSGALVETKCFAPTEDPDGALVGNVVEHWKRLAGDRQTVVFGKNVRHSIALRDEFRANGILAEHIDAKTPQDERDEILHWLETGDIQVVTNCEVLTTGWDQPTVSCAVLAFRTKSIVKYRQVCGRILRPAPGKEYALLIDHGANIHEHGWPDSDMEWPLDANADVESELSEQWKKERKNREPATCGNCGYVYPFGRSTASCPNCGSRYVPKPKSDKPLPGELKEVRRAEQEERRKTHSRQEKQAYWDQLLSHAASRGFKCGWAVHRFMYRYGVEPHGLNQVPRGGQRNMDAGKFKERQKANV